MYVLGMKYRSLLGSNRIELPTISDASDNAKLAKMIGENPETHLPINVLNYASDSRFMGAFNKASNPPSCHSESLLKPVGCETFAENERFNDYLVAEIEDARNKIKSARDDVEKRHVDAAKRALEQQQQQQQQQQQDVNN